MGSSATGAPHPIPCLQPSGLETSWASSPRSVLTSNRARTWMRMRQQITTMGYSTYHPGQRWQRETQPSQLPSDFARDSGPRAGLQGSFIVKPLLQLDLDQAKAWCQAAQKFTGGIGTKLCALLYGDGEKPTETGAKEELDSAEKTPACTCTNKPCSCQKADINYAFLHSTDLLPACNGEITTLSFLQDVMDILLQYVVKSFDRSTKVIDFHYPNELLQEHNWELADRPQTLEEILLNCRTTLKYAIKTGHPRYFNQLSTGLDMVGLAADWLTSTANTNIWENKRAEKQRSGAAARGASSPEKGGSASKLVRCGPRVTTTQRRDDLSHRLQKPTEPRESHFSVKKGAAALGIGTDSVILIRCDERGKMIPSDLERRIIEAKQKGFVPFLVSATAGTTVYGAFDPLLAIADICKKYKIWMHVDGLMQSCNQMHASYLFQQDKHYDLSYDTGDKALQCGRHVDVFKLWLMWRAKGTTGFEAQIDKCLELAEYLYNKIKNREGYEMVFDGKPQHTNVCFWYVPPSLRSMEDNEERMNRLLKVAPVIKARMMEYGTTMVSYQPLGDKVNFFRMVISNPAATHQDIDFLIEEIERLGQDL
ncbi:Glutamate decarboxylase 2 [Chelonia mydas]|uniref:Glutamate decarboxylase 2 n=1 Tax=Chelonia mydas TaxID=8469 RepID=M7BIK0_CHEMY|nr:Glutamate decarboxylase 2 [Chelonia mydas]